MKHGSYSTYVNYRCRCGMCRAAANAYQGEAKRKRRAARVMVGGRLVAPGAYVRHGDYSTYVNYSCRCVPCTTARTQRERDRRAVAS